MRRLLSGRLIVLSQLQPLLDERVGPWGGKHNTPIQWHSMITNVRRNIQKHWKDTSDVFGFKIKGFMSLSDNLYTVHMQIWWFSNSWTLASHINNHERLFFIWTCFLFGWFVYLCSCLHFFRIITKTNGILSFTQRLIEGMLQAANMPY